MTWGEGGEGGEGGEPPEEDEGPEEPEVDEEDEGPEEPEIDEEDEGPEEPEVDEEDEGPEEPEVDEEDEGPEEPEVDEEDEGPEEPEVDEENEGPEEPEVDEEDEGPEEPEVDEVDEGPEEPELDEEEEEEERGERLNFFDKVENGEKAKEDAEEGSQEHPDEGDVAERPDGERNEGFSENPEKKEEGEEDGKQELSDEREKKGEGSSEPKRESGANQEGFKEVSSPDSQFTTSREWVERKTSDGGWEQCRIDSTVMQNERTQTSVEKTSVVSRGETPEGDKIVGFAEGLETQTWARIDSNRFDDLFVKVRSIEQVQGVEISRPVDLSLMKFPEGEPVKEGIRIHSDPELKDVRMVGKTTEIWRDAEGVPHVRTTRWMLLQPEKGETGGETPKVDGDKTHLFGYVKINEVHLSKGKIDRKETFTWFSPVSGKSGEGLKGEAETSKAEGEAKTGEPPQGLKLLFGNREDDAARYDYRVKHEVTEVVYLPTETDTRDKTTGTSSVVENIEKTNDKTAENAGESVEKTEASSEIKTSEGIVKGTVVEPSEETAEKTIEELAEKTVERVDEKTAETLGESVEKTDEAIGKVKTSEGPVEKSPEETSEETAEGGEESVLVEVGDGEQVSPDDVLRMVIEGAFEFGGEEEYYEKAQEMGVQLDAEKLEKMLFVERRIPKEVYLVLASLGGDDKREKSEGEQTPGIKADTEPDAGVVPESSKEEEEKSSENTGETEREPRARERPEEEELRLEDLFTIVQSTLKGIAYTVSKEEFLKLYDEVVKKKGGEEKVAELLKRMKAGEAKVELLYDMVRNNEVPLVFLGAFLEFVEGTKNVEEKVREIVQKTIKLFKRLGVDLAQEQETGVQDSKVVEEGGGGAASAEEELRRKGYAYLGELIGRLLNERGLLDSWVFDMIMMRIKEPSQGREGGEKAKDIMERFREVWEGLGMDPKLKLSPIIPELYKWLERGDLLLFVYNGRVDPYGRRGRVVSRVDALETLAEAVRKGGSEANFLEVVYKRIGRRFFQYSVDAQLAEGRLDEEILRIAVEYVYEKREKIDGRWRLLNGNTDYILKRLMEEAFFFSHLEGLLEPLAELNRQLEKFDRASTSGEPTSENGEIPERETIFPNAAPQDVPEVESEVKTVEASSADTVTGESSDSVFGLMVQSLIKSLGLEKRLRRIYSKEGDGSKEVEGEKDWLKFLEPLLGERNLHYVLELVSTGLLKGFREGEKSVTMGKALEDVMKHSRKLIEEAGKMLLDENIGRLNDEEARGILEAAIEKYTWEAVMVEAVVEEYNEMVLEHVVNTQFGEGGTQRDVEIEQLSQAVKVVKKSMRKNTPQASFPAILSHEMKSLFTLIEEIEKKTPGFRRYIAAPYNERGEMTRYEYYKLCDALELPPRNKRVCRGDFLKALLKAREKSEVESAALGTHLGEEDLQKVLSEELRFYEMLEKEAQRIYISRGEDENKKELMESPALNRLLEETVGNRKKQEKPKEDVMKYLRDIIGLNDLKYTLELFVTRNRSMAILSGEEADKVIKTVKDAVKYYETRLERAIKILLNESGLLHGWRIEKLSDWEAKQIIKITKNKYPKKRHLGGKRRPREQEGFELWALDTLTHQLGIHPRTFKYYFHPNYDSRTCLTRYDYLRICDALELNQTERECKRVSRETLLRTLLEVEKEFIQDEQEALLAANREQLLSCNWSDQPSGTQCVFFRKDLQMLKDVALRKCGGNLEELGRRLVEMGVNYASSDTVRSFRKGKIMDVEIVLALIGIIIDRQPEEISELIQNKSLIEEFKNSLNSLKNKNLIGENDIERLSNLPDEIVREISLASLAEESGKEIKTPDQALDFLESLVKQNIINRKFSAHLPEEERIKLQDAIYKLIREEGSEENFYSYVARKLNKHLNEEEKIKEHAIQLEFSGIQRMPLKQYLLMCKIFKVEPNLELHSRSYRLYTHYLRLKVFDVDFSTPVMYRNSSGKTITIVENGKDFFVVIDGKWLKAEKLKTRYGGEWWELTVIDYVTEEGVYTLVKEAGELWPPYVRPWYTQITGRTRIRFKTAQPIKNLIQTIIDKTGLTLKTLSEITEIDIITLRRHLNEEIHDEGKPISLGHLLTLLGLKSTIMQTDIKKEIRDYEKEIDSMSGIKIPEEQRQDILYINLRTSIGARLIGHIYGDGHLKRRANRLLFIYRNSEKEYVESVSKLLNFYGYLCKISSRKPRSELEKEMHYVSVGGLLGYALWCAVPKAEGVKIVNNPKVPNWITGSPSLAIHFLRAIISDEAYIEPTEKYMVIAFSVNVKKILEEKGLLQVIQNIVKKRLEELREKWVSLGKGNEELTEDQRKEEKAARYVYIGQVLKEEFGKETVNEAKKVPSNILLSVNEAFQTLEINHSEPELTGFWVSKTGAVTAQWVVRLPAEETKKAYKYNLIEGYKKQNYELLYKRITRKIRFDKLSEKLRVEIRKIQEKIGRKDGRIPLSVIEKNFDSKLFSDIKKIINENVPEDIKKKKMEIEKKGIIANELICIYVGTVVIGVEWLLEWFEPP